MNKFRLSIAILLVFAASTACKSQVILLDQKRSDYRIILPAEPEKEELKAASEFQKYFEQISGVVLPVYGDEREPASHEIVIGKSARLINHKVKTRFNEDERDGFLLLTRDEKMFITGGSAAGTLNGVYAFLEEYLGCRLYSPEYTFVPKLSGISLPEINDRQVPFFSFRELLFPGRYDTNYLAWHKLHSHHDGSWGMWVHTFDDLVPPETYFKDHPEYFTEINGARSDKGQLCLSNPEVFEVLVENLGRKMAGSPDAHYWSVSQNDNYLACQCSECRKISEEYGGESGLMIWFVNRVAALYPDKVISTLAYQYTRSAPKHIKPLPNVNIMLCSIECNRSKPIEDDPTSASFVEDVKDWTKLTENILIWDYVVQFRNYISPFPNLRVLQPNLEFFADKGCKLMFQQGSSNSRSEFVDLRSYLIAKLLWDPNQDVEEIQSDFLYGYYGSAAPFIDEYIELLHDELESSGGDLWIYGYPYTGIGSFLRPALIPAYQELLDKAEQAVKDDPVTLDRVRFARLPLDYAILDISLHNVDRELSWFSEEDGSFEIKDEMVDLLDTFVVRCNRLNVETLNEQSFSPEDYRLLVMQYLLKTADRHLALDKPVELMTTFSPKYEAGGAKALTDGLRGINDYHFNWLGFEGEDLEAVIDLGVETEIHEISADFLQDIQAWVFLPESFTVYYSTDSEELIKIGVSENITPDNKTGAFIQTFSITTENVRARYIRVRAESMKICPAWHIGSGKSSWIFTDEILVK
jgi:hypothetical protein